MCLLEFFLLVLEISFWSAWTEKNLHFLRSIQVLDLVLKFRSDIGEGKWIKLLFYFLVLVNVAASFIGLSFFHLSGKLLVEIISHCSVTETFAFGFQNYFDHEGVDFTVFFIAICPVLSTSYLQGLKSARIVQV